MVYYSHKERKTLGKRMKLLFKQRVFSWLDSYDIYDEQGTAIFTVEGKLSWGHRLEINDRNGLKIGEVKEEVFTFLPKFYLYDHDLEIGKIEKEFTFFHPKFHLTCNDWQITGDIWEWDYDVTSPSSGLIIHAEKEIFHWSDTYVLNIKEEKDALLCLMIVLAIDAAKCSQNSN